MPSKAGVPVSKRSGTLSGEGRSLSGRSSSSSSGRAQRIDWCGPNHLYAEQTSASQPSAETSSLRCGAACTASTYTRAPAACAADTIAPSSGTLPTALLAAVTATQRVRSREHRLHGRRRRSSVPGSGSAKRTSAPARSAAISHGATSPSWSSRVQTISSPGDERAADGGGERERERGHARAEHEAARVASHESAGDLARLGHHGVEPLGRLEQPMPVRHRARAHELGHGVDCGVHRLRARGSIEARPAVAESREALAVHAATAARVLGSGSGDVDTARQHGDHAQHEAGEVVRTVHRNDAEDRLAVTQDEAPHRQRDQQHARAVPVRARARPRAGRRQAPDPQQHVQGVAPAVDAEGAEHVVVHGLVAREGSVVEEADDAGHHEHDAEQDGAPLGYRALLHLVH